MNEVLRIARLKIALQRAFLRRAILRVIIVIKDTRVPKTPKSKRLSLTHSTRDIVTNRALLDRSKGKNSDKISPTWPTMTLVGGSR